MALNFLWKRDKYHLRSVRRDVRKPIVEFTVCDLLLFAAIGAHFPDLHVAGAHGIEIDVLSIGRIFGAVIEALCGGKPFFFASLRRDGVNIEFTVALADESESLSVR